MTTAQIDYLKAVEAQRHDRAQEQNWDAQLAETVRSNKERESISRYSNELQLYATNVQRDTSRYVADTNAAASRYAANTNAATQRYIADQNARVQSAIASLNAAVSTYSTNVDAAMRKYTSDQSASTSRYATDTSAATSVYATDKSFASSVYRTSVESADRQARLDFDRETQTFKNSLESRRVALESMLAESNVERNKAQIERLASQTANDIAQLELKSKYYKLDKKAAEYNNALTRANTVKSYVQSVDTAASAGNKLMTFITRLIKEVNNDED